MAGFLEGGIGTAASDRRLPQRLPQQWQAGSSRDAQSSGLEPGIPGLPHRTPSSSIAQCSPLRTDSPASHSPLASAQDADVVALDQVIEATEEKKRVEMERLKGGAGEKDNASSLASATLMKESHDNTTALMKQYGHSMRSDSSPPRDMSTLEVQEPQAVHIDPVATGRLSSPMEYLSALAHLTTFGILGVWKNNLITGVVIVCIRYGLRILFINIANITAEDSSLFLDLPANMVGCFFMGWVGVVLKKDIAAFSEMLVIGLSTGLMGSITTYASWNQSLLFLLTKGLWVRSIFGLIIGMELAQMSLLVGMDSAKLLQSSCMCIRRNHTRIDWQKKCGSPDNLYRRKVSLLVFLAISIILWVAALVLTIVDVNSTVRRILWLSCVVGPPGVWARWLLARLNGQGIGRNQYLKWLPIGTLLTNVIASILEAVLATVLLTSPEDASLLCTGLQTGLLGCMSTVSTFVTEVYSLHQSPKRWRAYAYFCIMFFCSFSMGLIVYTIPVLKDHLFTTTL